LLRFDVEAFSLPPPRTKTSNLTKACGTKMGNHVCIDKDPLPLNEVLNTDLDEKHAKVKFNNKNNKTEYLSSLHVWRFYTEASAVQSVGNSCVALENFRGFDKTQVYLALHIFLAEPKHLSPSPSPVAEMPDSEVTMSLILSSSRESLTPRGLSNWVISRSDASLNGLAYCIYVWHGKDSDKFVQATALARGFDLDRILKNSRKSEYLFCRPEKLPLTAVFSVQRRQDLLEEDLKQNHLFQQLLKSGDPTMNAVGSIQVVGNGNPELSVSWLQTIFSPQDQTFSRSMSMGTLLERGGSTPTSANGSKSNSPKEGNSPKQQNSTTTHGHMTEKQKSLSSPTLPRTHKHTKVSKPASISIPSLNLSFVTNSSSSSSSSPAVADPPPSSASAGSTKPVIKRLPLSKTNNKNDKNVSSKPSLPIDLTALSDSKRDRTGSSSMSTSSASDDDAIFRVAEIERKTEKLKRYDPICSKITDQLFLGSQTVSKDLEQLKKMGITHVLNCAGSICPVYYPNEFMYRTLFLNDGVREDITCMFYDVIEWIENVINSNGKVLVHCQQGVSRSSAMMIGYMMWKMGWEYDQTQAFVKERRPVSNPNTGFICQLLTLGQRLRGNVPEARLLVIMPHSKQDASFLVAKNATKGSLLEQYAKPSSTCYILQTPECFYIWVGSACDEQHKRVAEQTVRRLQFFEHGTQGVCIIKQGEETREFSEYLGKLK
jgi:protein tyrosine phosphatase (PTP) superfamily phosphohydrolase (DUF442 family)